MTFQYKALPFGLKAALWIFTVVMAQVQQMPETRDINSHLDDWLAPVPDFATGVRHSTTLVQLCRDLGLVINMEKSDLVPAQVCAPWSALQPSFLQSQHDSRQHRDPPESSLPVPVNAIAVGQRVAQPDRPVEQPGKVYAVRQDQAAGHSVVPQASVGGGGTQVGTDGVRVRRSQKEHCAGGSTKATLRGAPIRLPEPQVLVQTDTSKTGWGGHSGDLTFQGTWMPIEALLLINIPEMRAVTLTLTALAPPVGVVVMVATDNTSVMHHINKQGGIRSQSMWLETKRLLQLAETNSWTLVSKYVPGRLNIVADQLSRMGQCQQTEWELH